MKYFTAVILLLSTLCFSPTLCSSQTAGLNADVEKLRKMEYDWLMAEFKMDTATIAAMMNERFVSVGLTTIANKQQELTGIYEKMSRRTTGKHVVDSLYLDDMQVQIFDNTAVVTFIAVTKGKIKDVHFVNRRTRMYDVWIKRNGHWKAISSQVTPIQ